MPRTREPPAAAPAGAGLLKSVEVAALLNVHPKHVYRLLRRGLPGRRVGGDWRFDRDEVLRTFPGFDGRDLVGSTRYTDSIVDDARLVLRVLDEALADGGVAINYAKVSRIGRDAKSVRGCVVEDRETGKESSVKAACVVNATGAWADRLRKEITGESKVRPLRAARTL